MSDLGSYSAVQVEAITAAELLTKEASWWEGRLPSNAFMDETGVDTVTVLPCKPDAANRYGLCQPPGALEHGRAMWLWSCNGGIPDGVVPDTLLQHEPKFTLAINKQVRDYFDEQGSLSSLSVTVDYRRLAAMLGGENRGYSPQVANNLTPTETARLFPYLQTETVAERLWSAWLCSRSVEEWGGHGLDSAGVG